MLLPNRLSADSRCISRNDWKNPFASPGKNLKNPGGILEFLRQGNDWNPDSKKDCDGSRGL
jgi:hypothetical protein